MFLSTEQNVLYFDLVILMFKKRFIVAKKHMLKNLIVSNLNNSILYISQTWEGKMHDKMMCDIEQLEFSKKVIL